jgi:hypothetical protein
MKRKILLAAFCALLGLLMTSCANGPAIRLGVTFKQGPELSLDFGATPVSTNSVPAVAP